MKTVSLEVFHQGQVVLSPTQKLISFGHQAVNPNQVPRRYRFVDDRFITTR